MDTVVPMRFRVVTLSVLTRTYTADLEFRQTNEWVTMYEFKDIAFPVTGRRPKIGSKCMLCKEFLTMLTNPEHELGYYMNALPWEPYTEEGTHASQVYTTRPKGVPPPLVRE